MEHDAVVVGGGHNGLVCAAYLARRGLDVLVLEARPEVGGCASTVDALGARVNVCNCDHLLVRSTPIAEELELERHGLSYLDLDPVNLALGWEGETPWFLFHDVDRTLVSLRLAYPGEVEGYRRYLAAALPVARLMLELADGPLSRSRALTAAARRRGAGLATLLAWSRRSAGDVLRSFFTSPALLGPAATIAPGVWGLPPDTPGTGLGAVAYALRHVVQAGRPVGGSGALPQALAVALEAAGGRIRTEARVTAIVADERRVRGVALAGGETIDARAVVVACDPRQALLAWLAEPPEALRSLLDGWRGDVQPDGYESKIDAVIARPPRYRGLDDAVCARLGIDDPLVPTGIVAPGLAGLAEAHRAMAQGRVAARPPLLANIPSALDPALRPEGRHVLSLEAIFTPYVLAGGWSGSREPERWLEAYAGLLEPGFLEGIVDWRVVAPPDYERDFGLARGYAPSFAGGPVAALLGRDPELSRYRTPLPGLYLTGAATFPGAGVWGASGRNTAQIMLERL
jgi:phytoene dehydrogenase-like protein